ncbi:MAG TPA: molybdopterin dinucleotide binding domain-containing protein, partial [Dehalococcoidia bacterium]|nr:molybdopterin dinucleotide binding domain-containing protein [Dehalococcoidia bacterium]
MHAALAALGDARPALLALSDLANAIGGADTWAYAHPDAVTDEIATTVPGYERFRADYALWGKARAAGLPSKLEPQPVTVTSRAVAEGELLLPTGRTLYTSLEGAALRLPDADKLHREEFIELHPADAAALRVNDEEPVTLVTNAGELTIRCKISGRVQEGVAFVPYFYDGGAVNRLLGRDGAPVAVRIKVAQPA